MLLYKSPFRRLRLNKALTFDTETLSGMLPYMNFWYLLYLNMLLDSNLYYNMLILWKWNKLKS